MAGAITKSKKPTLSFIVGNKELPLLNVSLLTRRTRVSRKNIIRSGAQFRQYFAKRMVAVTKEINYQYQRLARHVFIHIVKASPYKTGLLKSSWQISVSRPPRSVRFTSEDIKYFIKNPLSLAYSERLSIARISPAVAGLTYKKRVYIKNFVPYLKYLELGSSSQAPAGFVTKAYRDAIRTFAFSGNIKQGRGGSLATSTHAGNLGSKLSSRRHSGHLQKRLGKIHFRKDNKASVSSRSSKLRPKKLRLKK